MAYQNQKILEGSQIADADYRLKQFYGVKVSATGIVLAGDGEAAVGFLQNKPNITEQCEIAYAGPVKAIAGAVFARGIELACNAAGKVITAVAGKKVIGTALEAAAADGDVVTILITRNGIMA